MPSAVRASRYGATAGWPDGSSSSSTSAWPGGATVSQRSSPTGRSVRFTCLSIRCRPVEALRGTA
jgi:hypothetical protein